MRKIILGVLAAVALIAGTALFSAVPANAALGDNRCITKTEFRAVTKGTSMARAQSIIDYKGSQEYYFDATAFSRASQTRSFKACGSSYGEAYVDFEKKAGVWRVTSKWAYWG